jgi:hypothetical protein
MQKTDSLLNQEESLIGGGSLLNESEYGVPQESSSPTLLGADDNMTFAELNNDALTEAQIEERKKYFLNPKNQAEILLQNYIRNSQILVNHKQRRAIYASYLRDAKKGKFNKLFHDTIYGISKDESAEKIAKLNS